MTFFLVDFTVVASEEANPGVVGEVEDEGFEEGWDDVKGHDDGLAGVAVVASGVGDFDGEDRVSCYHLMVIKISPDGDVGCDPNAVGESCFRENVIAKTFQIILREFHLKHLMRHDIGRSHAESGIGAEGFVVLLFVKRLEVAEFVAGVFLHSGKIKDL